MSKPTKYTKEILERAVAQSVNYSDMLRKLGANPTGNTRTHIQKKLLEYGIPTNHFVSMPVQFVQRQESFVQRTLVKTSPNVRTAGHKLRKAMLQIGISYRCAADGCPNPEPMWREKPLTLEVDHEDGDYTNNLIDNLRFLCPNCHTQTETFGFVSKKEKLYCKCGNEMHKGSQQCLTCHRREQAKTRALFQENGTYPATEILVEGVEELGYTKYAATIGLTDNGLRKLLKRREVIILPKKLTKQKKADSI